MYKGERFNSISHLIGAMAALAGMVVLIVIAGQKGDPWKVVSFSIYGVTLTLLYVFSTLHHSLRGRAKAFFLKLDQCAIYLLIAGSYTPFTLVTLRGPWGWSIFGVVWFLAVVGIVVDALWKGGPRIVAIVLYLLMGWLGVLSVGPLWKALPPVGFWLLVAGGLFYTVGLIFYGLSARIPRMHGIWHCFVLGGSLCHYFTLLFCVA